ncbi:E3 ubiquitin-protein ligase RNF216-like [Zophobas morio]
MADNYKEQLTQIFSGANISEQQIDEVINIVLEQQGSVGPELLLEEMINLLVVSGDSTLANNHDNNEEGAVGITVNDNGVGNLPNTDASRDKDPIDVWEHLKQMLPNADPNYLRNQARVLVNRPPGELAQFIENAIEKNDYPTMQDYLMTQELLEEFDLYIAKFNVTAYLKEVATPLETYLDPKRKALLSDESDPDDIEFALNFLQNHFLYQRRKEIEKVFLHFDRNLLKTCNKLKTWPKAFRHPRQAGKWKECKNTELLKEISFFKHEKAIRQFIKQKDEKYKHALEEARRHGLLQTCACCYDDELIPEECHFCKKGCTFCKNCVKTGAEYVIGREETRFPCLAECSSEFDYSTLQMVLDSKTLEGVWHRKQIEEITNADIDGLETCPFCYYRMIPNEGDKVFKCQNVDCMVESCRQCRHKSHIPLRCNEIEFDEDVRMRTFIENKMTESLLRHCWKCSKQFYKDSGCNKMTCHCGAKMCYICGAAINDYSHFGAGGCPLWTENLQELHLNRVMEGARAAKDELGITVDPDLLKFDPTRNVERDVI